MDSIKSTLGPVTPKLYFCIRWDHRVTMCIPVRLSRETSTHYFFVLRWDCYGFNKKRVGTTYAEVVFLHLVGSVGHVVHSAASGA
jgi:hypothetical protein